MSPSLPRDRLALWCRCSPTCFAPTGSDGARGSVGAAWLLGVSVREYRELEVGTRFPSPEVLSRSACDVVLV